jgi:hypothetical protein
MFSKIYNDIFPLFPLKFRSNFSPKNIFPTAIFELSCGIFRYLATVPGWLLHAGCFIMSLVVPLQNVTSQNVISNKMSPVTNRHQQ